MFLHGARRMSGFLEVRQRVNDPIVVYVIYAAKNSVQLPSQTKNSNVVTRALSLNTKPEKIVDVCAAVHSYLSLLQHCSNSSVHSIFHH